MLTKTFPNIWNSESQSPLLKVDTYSWLLKNGARLKNEAAVSGKVTFLH